MHNTHEAEDIKLETDNPDFHSNNVVRPLCLKKKITVVIMWSLDEYNAVTGIQKYFEMYKAAESLGWFVMWMVNLKLVFYLRITTYVYF